MTPTTDKTDKPQAWRTTLAGAIVLVFLAVRVVMKPESMWEPGTGAILSIGCSLILGSDKLLGR